VAWRLWQQTRFNQMSEQIIGKIDDMGQRIDDLERSIAELMEQVCGCLSRVQGQCIICADTSHRFLYHLWYGMRIRSIDRPAPLTEAADCTVRPNLAKGCSCLARP
jgi:hypothetical protein